MCSHNSEYNQPEVVYNFEADLARLGSWSNLGTVPTIQEGWQLGMFFDTLIILVVEIRC